MFQNEVIWEALFVCNSLGSDKIRESHMSFLLLLNLISKPV